MIKLKKKREVRYICVCYDNLEISELSFFQCQKDMEHKFRVECLTKMRKTKWEKVKRNRDLLRLECPLCRMPERPGPFNEIDKSLGIPIPILLEIVRLMCAIPYMKIKLQIFVFVGFTQFACFSQPAINTLSHVRLVRPQFLVPFSTN